MKNSFHYPPSPVLPHSGGEVVIAFTLVALFAAGVSGVLFYNVGKSDGYADGSRVGRTLAKAQFEGDMKSVCASWFTDKRGAEGKSGKIIVCKAPAFLTSK